MNTTSFAFPTMFDVARNKLAIHADSQSITSRVKLLMLTEPTELYMNPTYGLGLRKYLYQYNNDNVIAIIRDKLVEQLRLWEPSVDADKTLVERGLINGQDSGKGSQKLELTVTLFTKYSQELSVSISSEDI